MSLVRCGYVKAQDDSPVGWLDLAQQMASLSKDVSHPLLPNSCWVHCSLPWQVRALWSIQFTLKKCQRVAPLWWKCNNVDILSAQWHDQSRPPAHWESRNLCHLRVCTCFIWTHPAKNCYCTCHNHSHSCAANEKEPTSVASSPPKK